MISFQELKDKPDTLLSLTGYTLEDWTELSPYFTKCFLEYVQTHTLAGKPRKKRRYKPYKNSRFDTPEDMLLFILIYLREAPKQVLFGALFGMSQPLANRWIHLLLSILNKALAELGELPSRETDPAPICAPSKVSTQNQEGEHFFHDSTERPIRRPKDPSTQKAYYSGKKKCHTVKNNLIINETCKVVLLTPSFEGRHPDKHIADMVGYCVPQGSTLSQDTGFQGFVLPDINIIQPKKKPRGRERTNEEKENNRKIASIRIRVEHAISGVKRCRIVKDKLRNWKKGFCDLVMETCCGLHNFRLNFRPWRYETPVI